MSGCESVKTTVVLSFASALTSGDKSSLPPALSAVLYVNATSSVVSGVPSEKTTSSRIVTVHCFRSLDNVFPCREIRNTLQVDIFFVQRTLKERIAITPPA